MVIVIETVLPVIRDVTGLPNHHYRSPRRNALPPSCGNKTGLHGDIRESPVMIVVIQVVGGASPDGNPSSVVPFTMKISGHPSLS